jgi:excisionase family DNA binding protein
MAKLQKRKINVGRCDPGPDALVLSVPAAGRMLGIARNAAYEAARSGEIPTIRVGGRVLVPKVALHAMLDVMAARPKV